MLIMRAGSSGRAALRSSGINACVNANGAVTFRRKTRSNATSGYLSKGAPNVVPELLTRMSSFVSSARTESTNAAIPAVVERSCDKATHLPGPAMPTHHRHTDTEGAGSHASLQARRRGHDPTPARGDVSSPVRSTCVPVADSRAAVSLHALESRDVMYTFTPFSTNAAAIMAPMPRPPEATDSATITLQRQRAARRMRTTLPPLPGASCAPGTPTLATYLQSPRRLCQIC